MCAIKNILTDFLAQPVYVT